MKSYRITVNGKTYDVDVEETGSTPSVSAAPKAAAPKKAETASAPAVSGGSEGSIKVTAPMPGKVLSISAEPGQSISKGDTILVFEAMKMENSVVAPQDGTIAGINVSVGESFEAGAVMASMN